MREIDVSRITLRITEKTDNKGESGEEHVVAKLTGDTLSTLKQCLVGEDTIRRMTVHRAADCCSSILPLS